MVYETRLMSDEQGYLKASEINLLIRHCNTFEETALLTLMWKTGGRISEILAITIYDIDFDNDEIKMANLKQKDKEAFKTIPLDKKTQKIILQYWEKRKESKPNLTSKELLFPFNRFKAYRMLQDIGKRAKIHNVGSKKLHPHHFRHSLAVHMAKNGVPIAIISNWLGHSSMVTTGYYQKFTSDDKKVYAKRLF